MTEGACAGTERDLFAPSRDAAATGLLGPSEFFLARWLFLRGLGAVFAIAFISLWVQIDGLVGSRGVSPIAEFLERVRRFNGGLLLRELPTLCWWNASDGGLHAQCAAGLALSLALVIGFAPQAVLVLLWTVYLSLCVAGQQFLSFQWDVLLLETGFFAVFFAPRGWRPALARERSPSRWSLFALRWLLFRLMLASGAVKLASGDATWRDLTALTLHYETQPLPTPMAWYAHHLPDGFQRVSCAIMFAIELFLPWFVFGPRGARRAAALAFVGFQLAIAITGNYGFFNLLTMLLCLPLLDDACLARIVPRGLARRVPISTVPIRGWSTALGWSFATSIAFLSCLMMGTRLGPGFELPRPAAEIAEWLAPLRTVNTYGLFAVMTTERNEITIEGSRDGLVWKPYAFEYKPGEPGRAPPWVAPHMPRLDWQMWFAALGRARDNPWFQRLLQRLLEGSPPVTALFAENPFPEAPPRYVRARFERYLFTDEAQHSSQGAWWSRADRGFYCPPVSGPSSESSSPR